MKEYYLATYKKTDGTYGTALVLSDSEAKAEDHFKDYESSSVRIAAEAKSTTTAARAVRLWSFEQPNKRKKAGVSVLEFKADAPAILFPVRFY